MKVLDDTEKASIRHQYEFETLMYQLFKFVEAQHRQAFIPDGTPENGLDPLLIFSSPVQAHGEGDCGLEKLHRLVLSTPVFFSTCTYGSLLMARLARLSSPTQRLRLVLRIQPQVRALATHQVRQVAWAGSFCSSGWP